MIDNIYGGVEKCYSFGYGVEGWVGESARKYCDLIEEVRGG